jgi:hypothetical protein
MPAKKKIRFWALLFALMLLFLVLPAFLISRPTIPLCEAVPPLHYQERTYYFASTDQPLTPSDLGEVVTTVGDGPTQARSCLLPAGTVIYSVEGYAPTTRLAVDYNGGLKLLQSLSPPPDKTLARLLAELRGTAGAACLSREQRWA